MTKIVVKVKAGARRNEVEKIEEGEYLVVTTAPATEGKANRAVIDLLAEYFDVPKSCVRITAGQASRSKIVDVIL